MKTTPAIYFRFFVEPNWRDFQEVPSDVRLGFNAAVTAFHLSDVFYKFYCDHDPARIFGCGSRKAFLKELGRREPRFVTVQTATTVYKHLHSAEAFLDASSPMAFEGAALPVAGVSVRSRWAPSNTGSVRVRRRNGTYTSLNKAPDREVPTDKCNERSEISRIEAKSPKRCRRRMELFR